MRPSVVAHHCAAKKHPALLAPRGSLKTSEASFSEAKTPYPTFRLPFARETHPHEHPPRAPIQHGRPYPHPARHHRPRPPPPRCATGLAVRSRLCRHRPPAPVYPPRARNALAILAQTPVSGCHPPRHPPPATQPQSRAIRPRARQPRAHQIRPIRQLRHRPRARARQTQRTRTPRRPVLPTPLPRCQRPTRRRTQPPTVRPSLRLHSPRHARFRHRHPRRSRRQPERFASLLPRRPARHQPR